MPSSRKPDRSSSAREATFSGRHAASMRLRSSTLKAWCTTAASASRISPCRANSGPIQ